MRLFCVLIGSMGFVPLSHRHDSPLVITNDDSYIYSLSQYVQSLNSKVNFELSGYVSVWYVDSREDINSLVNLVVD